MKRQFKQLCTPAGGFGTEVLPMIGQFVKHELNRSRIRLDVFETNTRAQKVYERCGYRLFGKSEHNRRILLLYEKHMQTNEVDIS